MLNFLFFFKYCISSKQLEITVGTSFFVNIEFLSAMRSTTAIFFMTCILISVRHGIPKKIPPRFQSSDPRKVNKEIKPWKKQSSGIKGGDLAVRGEFSYVVSIQRWGTGVCGGSFIDFQYIVTAAHCVVDRDGTFFKEQPEILANVVHLKENDVDVVKIKVKQVYVLKAYKPESTSGDSDKRVKADIAVLKLENPVNVVKYDSVKKLELPEKSISIEYTDKLATIVGFGWDNIMTFTDPDTDYVHEIGTSTGQLRFAQARIISNEDCDDIMYSIYESNICAKVIQREEHEGGEGACAGDSGGPLVHDNKLIGVLSTSPIGCVENKGSGVYARVSSYLDFIGAATHDEVTEDMRTKIF